jgi:hypothetical protein
MAIKRTRIGFPSAILMWRARLSGKPAIPGDDGAPQRNQSRVIGYDTLFAALEVLKGEVINDIGTKSF